MRGRLERSLGTLISPERQRLEVGLLQLQADDMSHLIRMHALDAILNPERFSLAELPTHAVADLRRAHEDAAALVGESTFVDFCS